MSEPAGADAIKIVAVLSLLHEPAQGPNSLTRRFRGEAPLAWTLYRLGKSSRISQLAVLCWEDQKTLVAPIAAEMHAACFAPSPRLPLSSIEAVAAARRWADGWRGGLMAACEFDRGFHGRWTADILAQCDADAALLVDPSAAVVDPSLIDALVAHACAHTEVEFCFSTAAPGLSGVLLRKSLLQQLANGNSHPGALLSYRPDLPQHDPASTIACAPVAAPLARTIHRFTLDSERQIDRISNATTHLNGQLPAAEAELLLQCLEASPARSFLPREIVLELNVQRIARPVYSAGTHLPLPRGDLSRQDAKKLIDEFAAADDARLLIAGAGDPLLCGHFFEVVDDAHAAGIAAIAVETDLLGIDAAVIDRLADSPLDVISVNLPAASAQTYRAVMGIEAVQEVMANLRRLIERRQSRRRGTPLIVPTFVKTTANLAEMEPWYDHWQRVLGCAVIAGPTDFARQIPDASVAQMEPNHRRACARLSGRLTVLSNGQVVACEQDVLARQPLGRIGLDSINSIWTGIAAKMRGDHAAAQWQRYPLCANCRDWHRP